MGVAAAIAMGYETAGNGGAGGVMTVREEDEGGSPTVTVPLRTAGPYKSLKGSQNMVPVDVDTT
jgi:hypothetical protein